MKIFNKSKILIVGGTGSFGRAMVERILKLKLGFSEIRVFSRDEKKQDDMRKDLNNQKIKFYIGDVRDISSIDNATRGIDYIFQAAALKQVPSCEFYPLEAVKTNILGTHNLLEVAEKNNVKKVICLSTDKAVYPVNAMGISKAMMEKNCYFKIIISKWQNNCMCNQIWKCYGFKRVSHSIVNISNKTRKTNDYNRSINDTLYDDYGRGN